MRNAGLYDAQAGIKIAVRNISNLRYTDDTTLMEEREEELKKASWWKWKKESEKAGLKLNIQKAKIMASGPITSWQIDVESVEEFDGETMMQRTDWCEEPPDVKNWLIGKDPDTQKDWRQEEKGMTEDEMVEWHHQLDEYEFEFPLMGKQWQTLFSWAWKSL